MARVRFLPREEEAIRGAVSTLVGIMLPKAEKMSDATARAPFSCLSTLLRPYIDEAVNPEKLQRLVDNRTRMWGYKIFFWDITEGDDRAELKAETGNHICRGLDALGRHIIEYVDELYEEDGFSSKTFEEFSFVRMKKRLGGMRPAISKGGGAATLRIYYEDPDGLSYLCQVDINRL